VTFYEFVYRLECVPYPFTLVLECDSRYDAHTKAHLLEHDGTQVISIRRLNRKETADRGKLLEKVA
jgi:hypothetical protein